MKDKLKRLASSIDEILQELDSAERSGEEEPRIDGSRIPKGTWVEVRDSESDEWCRRRFYAYAPQNSYGCFYVAYINEGGQLRSWRYCRLIENPPQPWFGGECPLPDGVRFRYWLRKGTKREYEGCCASPLYWSHSGESEDHEIIAFQILGEA